MRILVIFFVTNLSFSTSEHIIRRCICKKLIYKSWKWGDLILEVEEEVFTEEDVVEVLQMLLVEERMELKSTKWLEGW